ncbi:MAG: hypothetical protein AAF620_08745 [Bacteroidota bacterium]
MQVKKQNLVFEIVFISLLGLRESFAKLDFWFKSRLSEFQKRSLPVVNEAFEILSNEELGQKVGFSKDFSNQSL